MPARPSIDDQSGKDSQRLRHRPKPKSVEDYVGRYPRILEKIAVAAQLPSIEDGSDYPEKRSGTQKKLLGMGFDGIPWRCNDRCASHARVEKEANILEDLDAEIERRRKEVEQIQHLRPHSRSNLPATADFRNEECS